MGNLIRILLKNLVLFAALKKKFAKRSGIDKVCGTLFWLTM